MSSSEIYPIGTYAEAPFSEAERDERLGHLRDLPRLLEGAVQDLTVDDLQESYREGTWSIHQLVHHISDSHRVAQVVSELQHDDSTRGKPIVLWFYPKADTPG